MTAPRLRPAGRCTNRACRAPMVQRPHAATVDVLPHGYRFHYGRGLCSSCGFAARRNGTLDQHPRRSVSRDELLDTWVVLRERCFTYAQFAAYLGMSRTAVEAALMRARRAGDPRAKYARNRQSTGVAA